MYCEETFLAVCYCWTPRGALRRAWYLVERCDSFNEAHATMTKDSRRPKLVMSGPTGITEIPWGDDEQRDSYLVISWSFAHGISVLCSHNWSEPVFSIHGSKLPDKERFIQLCRDELDIRSLQYESA